MPDGFKYLRRWAYLRRASAYRQAYIDRIKTLGERLFLRPGIVQYRTYGSGACDGLKEWMP